MSVATYYGWDQAPSDFSVIWKPEDLFETPANGFLWDINDISTLFQDAAGTIPVTADGDPIGRILDKSGNGYHLTQTTAGSRPIYRVVDGVPFATSTGSHHMSTPSAAPLLRDDVYLVSRFRQDSDIPDQRIYSFGKPTGNDVDGAAHFYSRGSAGNVASMGHNPLPGLRLMLPGSTPSPLDWYVVENTGSLWSHKRDGSSEEGTATYSALEDTTGRIGLMCSIQSGQPNVGQTYWRFSGGFNFGLRISRALTPIEKATFAAWRSQQL